MATMPLYGKKDRNLFISGTERLDFSSHYGLWKNMAARSKASFFQT